MRQNVLEKVLRKTAKMAVESSSMLLLYEPKVPEKMLKKNMKRKNK